MKNPLFLSAEWRYLAMLNYAVEPSVLKPFVPRGTELEAFKGDHFVSVVGFRFLNTRVLGLAIPFHRDFDEVNLRFYVRRLGPEGWRRGVVFILELVPRRAIALVARTFYGEPYSAVPMRHRINHGERGVSVEYGWRRQGHWESIRAAAEGGSKPIELGSLEEFITEHYWGYTARATASAEYEVEHPRWRVWSNVAATLQADVRALYGESFAAPLASSPASALIADGSHVIVRRGTQLRERAPATSGVLENAGATTEHKILNRR